MASGGPATQPLVRGDTLDRDETPYARLGRKITEGTAKPEDLERAFGHRGQIFLASTFGGLIACFAAAPSLTVIDMAM